MAEHSESDAALQAELAWLRQRAADLEHTIALLQQHETVYQSLYMAMTEGVALHALISDASGTPIDYRILDINPAFERITGLSRAQAVGQLASQLYGIHMPPYLEQYAQVVATGSAVTFETTFAPMQKIFRIIAFATAPDQFATVFTDVTEQQRIETALRESEMRYRAVSELTSDYAFALRVDPDGTLVTEWVTDAFTRITGLSLAEANDPVKMNSLLHPDDAALLARHRARVLAGHDPGVLEFRIVRHGETRWLRYYLKAVWNAEQARVVRIYGAVQDITGRKRAEDSSMIFKALVDHAMDGILLLNHDGTVHYANAAAARMLGVSPEQLVGHDATRFVLLEERHRFKQEILPALLQHGHWQGEARVQRPDDELWHAQSSVVALLNTAGQCVFAASIFRDVTEQRRLEEYLRLTRFALDHAPDGVAFLGHDGRYRYVNHALCRALGYSREELLAMRSIDVDPHLSPATWQSIWQYLQEQGDGFFERVYVRKDGTSFPVEVAATYLDFEGSAYLCAFARDVSERKAYQQQIERLAFTDPLTMLANRRRLYEAGDAALTAAVQQQDSVALLYLDLDRFKAFNDALGHDAGDELLLQVTARLQRDVENRGLLARIGGDEFAILLTDTDVNAAVVLAHQILEQLRLPFEVHAHHVYLNGSIGIALGSVATQPFSLLLTRADVAMYRAKRAGSGVQVYDPSSNALSSNQVHLEAELRQALASGTLALHYQPILNLATRYLFGVEALVRWPHPMHGLLSPGSFLPLAEEVGLLGALDAWVLQAALTQVAAWDAAGFPLTVTVNVSTPSLRRSDFVEHVHTLISAIGVPANRLIIEVTEHTALHDLPLTYQVLSGLQTLGVRIALDDFGTGYASLSHLRELPVDILKIERAFAAGIGHNPRDEAVLRAVLALGQGLSMPVVAEGVEQEHQLIWLRDAGCRHIQGFLIGRPVPSDQINGDLVRTEVR